MENMFNLINHDNMIILRGEAISNVKFINDKNGKTCLAEFDMKVKRNYKTKAGDVLYDYPSIQYGKVKDFPRIEGISQGSKVSIVGTIRTDFYDFNNKKVKKYRVDASCVEVNVPEIKAFDVPVKKNAVKQVALPFE